MNFTLGRENFTLGRVNFSLCRQVYAVYTILSVGRWRHENFTPAACLRSARVSAEEYIIEDFKRSKSKLQYSMIDVW